VAAAAGYFIPNARGEHAGIAALAIAREQVRPR
jgi:hypothetical protein